MSKSSLFFHFAQPLEDPRRQLTEYIKPEDRKRPLQLSNDVVETEECDTERSPAREAMIKYLLARAGDLPKSFD